jgi:hypothetical protein
MACRVPQLCEKQCDNRTCRDNNRPARPPRHARRGQPRVRLRRYFGYRVRKRKCGKHDDQTNAVRLNFRRRAARRRDDDTDCPIDPTRCRRPRHLARRIAAAIVVQIVGYTDPRSTRLPSILICEARWVGRAMCSIRNSAATEPISKCGSTTVVSGGCMYLAISRSS